MLTKEQILVLLTTAFAGVRKDALNNLARTIALQATTEDEAKALIGKLTKEQVDEYAKEFRADVDKEVSERKKTIEKNLKEKFDAEKLELEKKQQGTGTQTEPDNPKDIAEAMKLAVAEAIAPLQKELSGFKAGEVAKSRLQQLNEKLNTCKDETFKAKALKDFGRMQFETDESFTEYLTETETDIAAANQTLADSALAGQGNPLFASKDKEGVSSAVANYVESQKPDSSALSGKSLT